MQFLFELGGTLNAENRQNLIDLLFANAASLGPADGGCFTDRAEILKELERAQSQKTALKISGEQPMGRALVDFCEVRNLPYVCYAYPGNGVDGSVTLSRPDLGLAHLTLGCNEDSEPWVELREVAEILESDAPLERLQDLVVRRTWLELPAITF